MPARWCAPRSPITQTRFPESEVTASYQLWFAVRYIHIVSVTFLLGGSALLCAWSVSLRQGHGTSAVVQAASTFEWMFWSIAGVLVLTGVSNLGLKGDGLMPPNTTWGTALTIKLTVALILLAFSLTRSEVVIRSRQAPLAAADRVGRVLGWLYGLTVVGLLTALWIGLGLAHGRY
jgi:cbb3-type cytochrome oxidase subunit 1